MFKRFMSANYNIKLNRYVMEIHKINAILKPFGHLFCNQPQAMTTCKMCQVKKSSVNTCAKSLSPWAITWKIHTWVFSNHNKICNKGR